MFFQRKKRKLDPRVRFQHASFTRKLDRAKTYQRKSKPVPEGFSAVMARLGLDSLGAKLIVLSGIAVLACLVYLPQLFFIRHISVTGLDDAHAGLVRGIIEKYLDQNKLPWPQRNIVLLSRAGLSGFILENDKTLAQVANIKKHPFHGLSVDIAPKHEKYLLTSGQARYVIYDDGTVVRSLPPDDQSPHPELVALAVGPAADASPGARYLSANLTQALQTIITDLPGKADQNVASVAFLSPIVEIKTPEPVITETATASLTQPVGEPVVPPEPVVPLHSLPLDPREVYVYTPKKQNGKDSAQKFRIVIDTQNDLADVLSKLGLLLHKLPPEQYNRLSYVDMRLPDRAYVCLARAACDK